MPFTWMKNWEEKSKTQWNKNKNQSRSSGNQMGVVATRQCCYSHIQLANWAKCVLCKKNMMGERDSTHTAEKKTPGFFTSMHCYSTWLSFYSVRYHTSVMRTTSSGEPRVLCGCSAKTGPDRPDGGRVQKRPVWEPAFSLACIRHNK